MPDSSGIDRPPIRRHQQAPGDLITPFSFLEIGAIAPHAIDATGGPRQRTSPKTRGAPGPSTTALPPGPVRYDDSISPEHFELERDAVFRGTWPTSAHEAAPAPAPTSPRSSTPPAPLSRRHVTPTAAPGVPQRLPPPGHKLVWDDSRETSGCRQFTCKYHGWRYGLEGDLTFVQQESEFFLTLDRTPGWPRPCAVGVGGSSS